MLIGVLETDLGLFFFFFKLFLVRIKYINGSDKGGEAPNGDGELVGV